MRGQPLLFGMVRLIQLITPIMREQHEGKIVNISSMGGKIWTKFGGRYHATKYALEGMSDCLRMELKPFGIDVIVVEPGGIRTEWGIIAANNLKKTSAKGAYAEMANKAAEGMIRNYSGEHRKLFTAYFCGLLQPERSDLSETSGTV